MFIMPFITIRCHTFLLAVLLLIRSCAPGALGLCLYHCIPMLNVVNSQIFGWTNEATGLVEKQKMREIWALYTWEVNENLTGHLSVRPKPKSPCIVKVKSLSRVRPFATPCTVGHQAPPSEGFPRQEHWSGVPFPSPGGLPDPGIKAGSPALQADALTSEPRPPQLWRF